MFRILNGQYVDRKISQLPVADGKGWETTENPRFSLEAATFEKAHTYFFAGSLIRNAEADSPRVSFRLQ
jgi:hypothetical protein